MRLNFLTSMSFFPRDLPWCFFVAFSSLLFWLALLNLREAISRWRSHPSARPLSQISRIWFWSLFRSSGFMIFLLTLFLDRGLCSAWRGRLFLLFLTWKRKFLKRNYLVAISTRWFLRNKFNKVNIWKKMISLRTVLLKILKMILVDFYVYTHLNKVLLWILKVIS